LVLLCQDKRTILLIEIFENADSNEVLSERHYYPFGLAYNGPWIDNKAKQTRYQYAWNNPVLLTDPDRRCPWCIGAIVGAAVDYGLQVAGNLAEGSKD